VNNFLKLGQIKNFSSNFLAGTPEWADRTSSPSEEENRAATLRLRFNTQNGGPRTQGAEDYDSADRTPPTHLHSFLWLYFFVN
jgi:hypothetical protein